MIPSTYKDAKIVITPNVPMIDDYFAIWTLNYDLTPTIYIDTKVVEAVSNGDISIEDLINSTLAHEYDEAKLSIELALKLGYDEEYIKENFTGLSPKDDKIFEIGGEAHEILANNYPGGRKEFEEQLSREFDVVYGSGA